MSRPLVSVVMATYNRAHLLKRSLQAYANQDFDNDQLELVVIDDSSEDETKEIVHEWSHDTGIKTVVLLPLPKKDVWRDCGAILNYGIRASSGKHIILTHPEVIPGRRSVAECVLRLQIGEDVTKRCLSRGEQVRSGERYPMDPLAFGLYVCCRVYYLSPKNQEQLDSVPWRSGNLAVRSLPGFYNEDTNGQPDFTHMATDAVAQPGSRLATWESWVFGGCSRETWKRMGGMLETSKWGSVDVSFMQRRRTLGIPNHTCPEDDTIVIHQNHDGPMDIPTPRIEEAWKKELGEVDLTNGLKMCYPEVDYLGWG